MCVNIHTTSNFQSHDCNFLSFVYSLRSKLSAVKSSTPFNHGDLPAGVKVPQVVLASEPVPPGDIAFVSICICNRTTCCPIWK